MRIVYFIIISTFTFKISKNQGLTNSLANISHENLLDNPWFTVNQRGETSSYFADRWIKWASELTFTNNDGVTISGTPSSIENLGEQRIEWDRLKDNIGKPITLSVLIDGTIYKGVGKIETPTSSWRAHVILELPSLNISFHFLTYGTSPSTAEVILKNFNTDTINVTIKAIKLELGSVSTLAMDTVPNYATELLKCQRYFVRLKSSSSSITFPAYVQSTSGRATLQLPVAMRALPTITKTGTLEWVIEDNNNVQMSTITAVSDDNQFIILKEDNIFPSVTGYCIAILRTWTNAILDISADL